MKDRITKSAHVSLYLRSDLLEQIDANRGLVKRSSLIQQIVKDYLEGQKN